MMEQAVEIQFGPITLFDTLEPEIPDILTQASIVASYYEKAYREKLRGQTVNLQQIEIYTRLAQGDLSAMYRQRTEEEVNLERKSLTVDLNGQTYLYYNESVMQMSVLPIDQQLLHEFYKARVASWIDKNSKTVFWPNWNKARKKSEVEQTDTLKILAKHLPGSTAEEIAYGLARAAVDIPSHNGTDKQALVNIILKDIFISDRIIYPLHLAFPVQITSRVPSWIWRDGLKYLVPAWWLIEKQEDLEEFSDTQLEKGNT